MKPKTYTQKDDYERELRPAPKMGDTVYYRDMFNKVQSMKVKYSNFGEAQSLYRARNYFLSKSLAEAVAKAVTIKQDLMEYARSLDKDYSNPPKEGYTISYNSNSGELELGATGYWYSLGEVVFETEEGALSAMKKFKKELIWLFTEADFVHRGF